MPARIKMRSVSVEDLGHIVKQMIDGVLDDNDQVAKLRQAVLEEYYLKKMEELKQVKAKIDADYKLNQLEEKEHQIDTSDSKVSLNPHSFEIGDTSVGFIVDNKQLDSHELSAVKFNESPLIDYSHSKSTVKKSSQSGTSLNSQKVDELDYTPPVVHILRRQKYVKLAQVSDVQAASIHGPNISLDSANHHTKTGLTQSSNDLAKNRDNIKTENQNVCSNLEIIKWRNSVLQIGVSEQNGQLGKTREIPVQFKSRGEIAFENWTKEKTNAYHRVFREEKKRKGLEQAAKAKQIEKKEAANEAYKYWRRQQDARQKLRNTSKRILAQIESQKSQSRERSRANSQAFKVWKRQKDIKLRERKMYMMAYSEQSDPRQQSKPQKPNPGVHVAFDMWLDQLDCVLHQKYLRERRYLVRSFYCQPAYFGTTALRAR